MKQIDIFVDSIYKNIYGEKEEIDELKGEMKYHLFETVEELKSEGKTEQEAIEIAIKRFGEKNELQMLLSQMFQIQKTFAKWVIYLSISCLIIGLILFSFLYKMRDNAARENSDISWEISQILENEKMITKEMEEEIIQVINRSNHIVKVEIFDMVSLDEGATLDEYFKYIENNTPAYQYKKENSQSSWMEFNLYGNGHDNWYIQLTVGDISDLVVIVLFMSIAIYATLFTIWAIVNAYHHKRLNVMWILIFILFNVLGYLAYYLIGKVKK